MNILDSSVLEAIPADIVGRPRCVYAVEWVTREPLLSAVSPAIPSGAAITFCIRH